MYNIPSDDTSATVVTNNNDSRKHNSKIHSHWGSHAPVVKAMLQGNRMNTCADVRSVLANCLEANSHDSICKTAATYFEACMNASRYQD